jgi:hypothetical protein
VKAAPSRVDRSILLRALTGTAAAWQLVQVQRLLGHHSPAFTLARYSHLMPGEDGGGLDLRAALGTSEGVQTGVQVEGVWDLHTLPEAA